MTHRIEARVYYEDTDAGGIMYYANYLKFMERARTEWLRALGIESQKMMEERGICFVVSRVDISYKRPARLDDVLAVGAATEEMGMTRIKLRQNVTRGADLVAEAMVEIAMIDLKTGRGVKIPDDLKAKLSAA